MKSAGRNGRAEKAAETHAVEILLRRMSSAFVKLYSVGICVLVFRKGFKRQSLSAAGVKYIDIAFGEINRLLN